MRILPFLPRISLVVATLCLAITAAADVRKVALAKTPAAVRETITRVAAGAKINAITRRAEAGEVTFEVSVQRKGAEREFTVADDGELLAMEVGLEEVPAPARATIQRALGANKAETIERITEEGEIAFEVTFLQSGHARDFTVSENGVVSRFEIGWQELPRVVRAGVEKFITTNQLERVDRIFDEGELSYDIQFTAHGSTRVLSVGTNGVVSRLEVGLADTPKAVQNTIHAQLKGWKLGDIDKVFDDDEITYEVEAKKGRATREFTIDAAGKLTSETIELNDAPPAVRETVRQQLAGGKLLRLERNYEEDGSISFDVESKKNGKAFDFSVAADGKFLGEN